MIYECVVLTIFLLFFSVLKRLEFRLCTRKVIASKHDEFNDPDVFDKLSYFCAIRCFSHKVFLINIKK